MGSVDVTLHFFCSASGSDSELFSRDVNGVAPVWCCSKKNERRNVISRAAQYVANQNLVNDMI